MRSHVRNALALIVGFIVLWYAGAMFNFFPFMANDLTLSAVGFTGLLLCIVMVLCTVWIISELRTARNRDNIRASRMTIEKMEQPEAQEIADRWKYDGEYDFYDLTADPDDYEEITTPALRRDNYFSVFNEGELIGYFTVEQDGADISLGLGMRPDLTGQGLGRIFVNKILRYLRENYQYEKIRLTVAAFNKRAAKLYTRLGFKETGTERLPSNGGMYDFILMELEQR